MTYTDEGLIQAMLQDDANMGARIQQLEEQLAVAFKRIDVLSTGLDIALGHISTLYTTGDVTTNIVTRLAEQVKANSIAELIRQLQANGIGRGVE